MIDVIENQTAAPGSLEAAKWPFIVYFFIALVSTPLYIAIVVKLFLNRNSRKFSSTFYTLLLSQGFADLFYIFIYTTLYVLSFVGTVKGISPFFKWTTANITYKCLCYSLSLRCVGVTLISLQRYLIICKWRSRLNKVLCTVSQLHSCLNREPGRYTTEMVQRQNSRSSQIKQAEPEKLTSDVMRSTHMDGENIYHIAAIPRYAIVLLHWTISLLFVVPIMTIDSIRFGCVCKQMVAIDPDDFQLSTINSEVVVLTTFLLCVGFYSMTIRYVYCHRKRERQLAAEIRLCVPVAALVFAFFLIFLYHLIQLIWIIIYHEQYRALRVLEPLFSGFLSFFTPWMLLLSSREISGLFIPSSKVSVSLRRDTTQARTQESNLF